MATTSAVLGDEILSTFADAFHQFKTFSVDCKKLLAVWYFRLFVKCSTISILLLLGIFHYRNGVFDYNECTGFYLAILIIYVFSSSRQLIRDRRLETYFIEISGAFEGMTEMLSEWCQVNNPSFAKIFKLLLEETKRDRNIELKMNDLIPLIIFDVIIWFANAGCLLVNTFHQGQFHFTVLVFFIITLMIVAMENLLINVKKIPSKVNENMTEEINKICSIVKKYNEVQDDTDNCYGETKTETTDKMNDDSGFMKVSYLLNYQFFFYIYKKLGLSF